MDAIVISDVTKRFKKSTIRRDYTTLKSELVKWGKLIEQPNQLQLIVGGRIEPQLDGLEYVAHLKQAVVQKILVMPSVRIGRPMATSLVIFGQLGKIECKLFRRWQFFTRKAEQECHCCLGEARGNEARTVLAAKN